MSTDRVRALKVCEKPTEALAKHGKPEIFNTVQVSQHTSGAWIDMLTGFKVRTSTPLKQVLKGMPGSANC